MTGAVAPQQVGRVLVTGATGAVGGALVDLLAGAGVATRALCRTQQQSTSLARRGIEPVLGDLDDQDSLQQAMRGCDRLFLLTPPTPSRPGVTGAPSTQR